MNENILKLKSVKDLNELIEKTTKGISNKKVKNMRASLILQDIQYIIGKREEMKRMNTRTHVRHKVELNVLCKEIRKRWRTNERKK